jgi:hypothetical protein
MTAERVHTTPVNPLKTDGTENKDIQATNGAQAYVFNHQISILTAFITTDILGHSGYQFLHKVKVLYKYDRDYLCVNKSQFIPVIFEPPCILPTDFCLVS